MEEDPDHAYVVMEWARGDSLDDLLADGPLDPGQGAEIIARSAEALAAAHAAGVAHLRLTPRSLRWTPGGGVKISGLGVDAALAGVSADDPALADTRSPGGAGAQQGVRVHHLLLSFEASLRALRSPAETAP